VLPGTPAHTTAEAPDAPLATSVSGAAGSAVPSVWTGPSAPSAAACWMPTRPGALASAMSMPSQAAVDEPSGAAAKSMPVAGAATLNRGPSTQPAAPAAAGAAASRPAAASAASAPRCDVGRA
jgi:hypothetical protein